MKGLYENGYEDIAERVLIMLKQRVIGDYLQTSAIFDSEFRVLSALNDRNDYMGPGTGYSMSQERWNELKVKYNALNPEYI